MGALDLVRKKADVVVQNIADRLMNDVRSAAPVDSGDLRASITMSVNTLPSVFNGGSARVKAGDVVYVATDKAYAPVIEYGLYPNPPKTPTGKTINGYSVQAPKGFMRVTALNVIMWARSAKWN
ncbi:HK97 gp10 family phage protein [Neisseria shayeganii]|uniref:Putative bacteriophage protein n=1 Tax=Neisseria shayeganii 871 TaxID=1032488 RepID=G4CG96_9NEIS|nr:HK97 gp10 family phage protein [Neisseria shayeganii]EGY53144.1 putative bacteriophage protein [Neisseria shayeganii 871]